jgi:hypothetical protein
MGPLPSHIVPPPRAGFGTTFGYLALLDLLVAHRAVQHGQSCRPGSGRAGRPPPGSLVNGALIDTGHAKRDDFPWISDRAFDREVTVCSASLSLSLSVAHVEVFSDFSPPLHSRKSVRQRAHHHASRFPLPCSCRSACAAVPAAPRASRPKTTS